MLSRAVNVFRKKKSRKSSSLSGSNDEHGTDTNASETETEPDDCSCHSEPPALPGSSGVSSSQPRQHVSPASSTEYFQAGPEKPPPSSETPPHNEASWMARRRRRTREKEQERSPSATPTGSLTSSLLSTIRRARSRSRSRSISSSSIAADASGAAPKLLPTSKSTLSSPATVGGGDADGGVASSALVRQHGTGRQFAPAGGVGVSSVSFACDTKTSEQKNHHLRYGPSADGGGQANKCLQKRVE
uniref:Uncharacterized protein n=1 Tax=Anopheles dirus TaxID=7168 RepID=A0A182NT63_9DIPT